MKKLSEHLVRVGLLAASAFVPATASAQQQPAGNDEVVVTAQRREQSLQDVPLAVSAIQADSLSAQGVTDLENLGAAVPGLITVNSRGSLTPFLRGVGTTNTAPGDEGSIALYVDGVYYASVSTNSLSLSNVTRVEVLRGPQGTLFGRNATGGLVQIVTKDPSQTPSADVSVGFGSYEKVQGAFYGTTGLTDNVAVDLALGYEDQGEGWGRNIFLNRDVNYNSDRSARAKLLWNVTPSLDFLLTVDYAHAENDIGHSRSQADPRIAPGATGTLIDGIALSPGQGFYDTRSNLPRQVSTEQAGVAAKLTLDMGWGELSSLTAYRVHDASAFFDQDGSPLASPLVLLPPPVNAALSPADVILVDHTQTWQQEFLLTNSLGALDLTSGIFIFNATAEFDPFTLFNGGFPGGGRERRTRQITRSYAGFSQGTYHVTDATDVTVGVRYTKDERDISGKDRFLNTTVTTDPVAAIRAANPDAVHRNYYSTTYRLALDHNFTDDLLGYVSFGTGFKSGVFNVTSPVNASNPANSAVAPEQLEAAAIGFKSDWFDNTLRVNVEAYHYDYTDIQLLVVSGGTTVLVNAAGAEVDGADIELQWAPSVPVGELEFDANVAFANGKYTSFPNAPLFVPAGTPTPAGATCFTNPTVGGNRRCSFNAAGNDMQNLPDFTSRAGVTYAYPLGEAGELGFNLAYYYNDGFALHSDNRVRQTSYDLVSAQLSFTAPGDKWRFRIWGQNLGDSQYYQQMSHAEFGDQVSPGPPMTWGVGFDYHFGQ